MCSIIDFIRKRVKSESNKYIQVVLRKIVTQQKKLAGGGAKSGDGYDTLCFPGERMLRIKYYGHVNIAYLIEKRI